MNDIKEYTATTSPYEVFTLLSDKIVRGELVTFNALRAYCAPLPDSPRTEAILRRAFELQRRLYWGFFRDISPVSHSKVWNKVVVPDRKYRFAGDIKRMATIPDVYMAIIDIHGYTRFCQKNRHNMSMLDLLDRVLQSDLPDIAAKFGVVSRRASGDEILLLGGSAAELFEVVFLMARRLAKSGAAKNIGAAKSTGAAKDKEKNGGAADKGQAKDKPAEPTEPADALPSFQISAGVAGGAKYAQLVITRDGDLSGTIVNTAARLQARANRISPDRTKILLTSVTFQKLKTQPPSARYEFLKAVDFFDTGMVEFKGINVPVFDTVFLATEANRLEYRDRMGALYDSIGQGLWSSHIFADALNLMARIVTSGSGCLVDEATGQPIDAADSISIIQRIKKAQGYFVAERYELAVNEYSELADVFCRAKGRDPIVVEYLTNVRDNYRKIVEAFTFRLDQEIDMHLEAIFLSPTDRTNFRTLEKHFAMFGSVRDAARFKVQDRRSLWAKSVEDASEKLGVKIQAKK
jgi:class 3 adenylate cyclase